MMIVNATSVITSNIAATSDMVDAIAEMGKVECACHCESRRHTCALSARPECALPDNSWLHHLTHSRTFTCRCVFHALCQYVAVQCDLEELLLKEVEP